MQRLLQNARRDIPERIATADDLSVRMTRAQIRLDCIRRKGEQQCADQRKHFVKHG